MGDSELEKILHELHSMGGRFEQPTTAAAPHLVSGDRATFKRLMLESKTILDEALSYLNNFGIPLLQMTQIRSYGMFNPPNLEELQEATVLVEGGLNPLRLKQVRSQAPKGTLQRPAYVKSVIWRKPIQISAIFSRATYRVSVK